MSMWLSSSYISVTCDSWAILNGCLVGSSYWVSFIWTFFLIDQLLCARHRTRNSSYKEFFCSLWQMILETIHEKKSINLKKYLLNVKWSYNHRGKIPQDWVVFLVEQCTLDINLIKVTVSEKKLQGYSLSKFNRRSQARKCSANTASWDFLVFLWGLWNVFSLG